MTSTRQSRTECVDERRLARTGYTGDADTMRVTRVWQQAQQHLLCQFLMFDLGRFDERQCAPDVGTVAGTHPVDVGVDVDGASAHSYPSCALSLRIRSIAASAMTVPGGKMAAAPAARSASKSCDGMTPPTTTKMSGRSSAASSRLSSGTRVR